MIRSLLLTLLLCAIPSSYAERNAHRAEEQPPGAFLVAASPDQPRVLIALVGARRYSLVPPYGWRTSWSEEERTIFLAEPRSRCVLKIRFNDHADTHATAGDAEAWLRELKKSCSNCKIEDQPPVIALGQQCQAFDLFWLTETFLPRVGRFVRLPAEQGTIELSFTSAPEDFGKLLPPFMQFVSSLRSAGTNEQVEVRAFPVE